MGPLLSALLLVASPLAASFPAQAASASDIDTPAPHLTTDGPTLDAMLRVGVAAYQIGDLAAANASWQRFREAYPQHPAAATFELRILQARRSLDYWGGQHDEAIRARALEAETLSRAWLERSPESANARFYLGAALLELMVINGIDGHYFKAGTQGEQARKILERALELDPDHVDAKLPLGLYHYYASIATKFIPFLRWLWFVPDGDHDTGLALMEDTRRSGDLFQFDAAMTLAGVYLYVEERPDLVEPVLEEIHARYPRNTAVKFEIVEVRFRRHDYAGAIDAALELEAGTSVQFGDEIRRTMARIWRMRAELHRGQTERADAILTSLESRQDELSSWSQRWVYLTRGQLHDLAGDRARAIASYQLVSQKSGKVGSRRTSRMALEGIERRFELPQVPEIMPVGAGS